MGRDPWRVLSAGSAEPYIFFRFTPPPPPFSTWQVSHFNYLGCDVSYNYDADLQIKLNSVRFKILMAASVKFRFVFWYVLTRQYILEDKSEKLNKFQYMCGTIKRTLTNKPEQIHNSNLTKLWLYQ
jgi:hypothetical protein